MDETTICIVSDLHIDINRDGNFGFRVHPDYDILLIAGDIAGGYEREEKFLKGLSKDIPECYVIAGNHLGYDYGNLLWYYNDRKIGTKQWSIDYLKDNMPENIHYMDNDWVDIGNYILFGGTMYSDYKLYENSYLCQRAGIEWLNDFRYVNIYDKKQKVIRPVRPCDYIKLFDKFMRRLRKCIKETTKDIIVLTHFAPSIKSIAEKYLKGDIYLNASYASNLEDFISKNKRIKYWIHGHVHSSFDYMIEQCRVVCEPYGYHHNGEQVLSPLQYKGKQIKI